MRAPPIDVLVRGAGPVGCVAALALRDCGLEVAVLERSGAPERRFRPIALSYGSRLILERVAAWQQLATTAINTVQVSQKGIFGRTLLEATDAGVPALGYVVEYDALHHALHQALGERGVALVCEAPEARCDVHAEGWSDATEKRYAQEAIVALADFNPRAQSTAYERFTEHGPLALLPLAGSHALIWSTQPDLAGELAAASEERFLMELAAVLGTGVGRPVAVRHRSVQALTLRVRTARVSGRSVYIGNAAQTVHPVAGQGLNLGFRDAWDLAQILRDAPDPGAAELLARFAARRKLDTRATIRMTDVLARAFLGSTRAASVPRGLALTLLDVLPAPRRFFARRMIFGASAWP